MNLLGILLNLVILAVIESVESLLIRFLNRNFEIDTSESKVVVHLIGRDLNGVAYVPLHTCVNDLRWTLDNCNSIKITQT